MKRIIKNSSALWKNLLAAALVATASLAVANEIYIDQIGDNSTVSVTQTGAGNIVNGNVGGTGANDDAAIVRGDLNTVTITQIGASNTASIVINNETNGTGAAVVVSADGSGNNQTVGCGTALASTCNANTIRSEIVGNNNTTVQTLSGGAAQSKINVTGNYNSVSHTASGAGLHTGDITVTGSGTSAAPNTVTLTQTGASNKNAVITSNGSNNNVTVTQSD
jgi:hypothetical protein